MRRVQDSVEILQKSTSAAGAGTTPIDVVITWVDGDDPRHAAARAKHRPEQAHPKAVAATRFTDRGEIGFSVCSVLKFCPFVRHIHIVTDDQFPRVLEALFEDHPGWRDRVSIVDHKVIFNEHADLLPVFSSRSIETMIHRIPGLAEHFIYLNDDMFIGRELRPDHFFRGGQPVLRGVVKPFPAKFSKWLKSIFRRGPQRAGYKEAQQVAARMVGCQRSYLQTEHLPNVMRRSTLEDFFENRQSLLRSQASHRFRSPEQFSPIGLANHLEFMQNAPIEKSGATGYIKPARTKRDRRRIMRTLEALDDGALDSLCVQSLDAMAEADQETVLEALRRRYEWSPQATA